MKNGHQSDDYISSDKYITSTQEKILQSGASKSRAVHVGDFILSRQFYKAIIIVLYGQPSVMNAPINS